MSDARQDADLQAIWQSQSQKESAMSIDLVREKAQRLERLVGRRNRMEDIGAAIAVAGFARIFWLGPTTLIRVGAAMVIVAAVVVVALIHRWGSTKPLPGDFGLRSAIEFHRAQLEAQRDLLRGVLWWYLLPFVPGFFVVQLGRVLAEPARVPQTIAFGVLTVVLMVVICFLNRRGAARIQERIDLLNAEM